MSIYNDYYVYAYIKKSTLTPYYIGKGRKNRINEKHKGISIPKEKCFRVIMESNLTNLGACALERRYIRWYGRKDNKTGILLNKTEGGDGWFSKHSMESKRKMSLSQIGIKKPRTKEHQNKLSCNSKFWQIIFPSGKIEIINNIRKFARENGLSESALKAVAYRIQNRKQHKGFQINPTERKRRNKTICI